MILNVEPGGCGPDTGRPGRARDQAYSGRRTATPPSRLPCFCWAARCRPGLIVACTGRPRRTFTRRMRRLPKRSSAPGRPPRRGPERGARGAAEAGVEAALRAAAGTLRARRLADDRRRARDAVEALPVGGEDRRAV